MGGTLGNRVSQGSKVKQLMAGHHFGVKLERFGDSQTQFSSTVTESVLGGCGRRASEPPQR